jgi:uncharacterized protein
MTIQTWTILILIGLSAGALGGILGIGGGLILIPGLVLFLGLDQHTAIGTSLAVLLPPIGLFAAYNYYKAGDVNLKYGLIIAAAFMVGSFFSSKVALMLPELVVRRTFSILLLVISVRMFFAK